MNSTSQYVLGALILTVANLSWAAGPGAGAPTNNIMGIAPVITPTPGTYENINVNDTAFINIYNQLDADDSNYVKTTIADFNKTMSDLYKNQMARIMALQNKGLGIVNGVDLQEFLQVRTDLQISMTSAKTLIDVVAETPSARQTGNKVDLNTGKINVTTQGRLTTVNFSEIRNKLISKITSLEQTLNALEIRVYSPQKGGAVTQIVGAPLEASLKVAFSPKQITELQKQANEKEHKATQFFRFNDMKSINESHIAIMKSFIETYGMNDKYRLQTDDAGFKNSLVLVEELFITRSLMRYRYGVPLGAFGTPDTRRAFHLNLIPKKGDNELAIDDVVYYSLDQLMSKRRAIVEILNTQTDRSKNPLGKDVSILARLSSSINFLRGSLTYSYCNAFVLGLMLNDIDEEIMLTKPGGLALVKVNIQKRIVSSANGEEEKQHLKSIMTAGDTSTGVLDKNNAVDAGGSFETAKKIADSASRYQTYLNQANEMRVQAAAMQNGAGLNTYSKLNAERVDELFNK